MLFNSLTYIFFLPAVVLAVWGLPARFRPAFLLAASYVFYANWNPPFLALIVGMTLVNYGFGLAQARAKPRSRLLVALAVTFNLAGLGTFKYLGLLDKTALSIAHAIGLTASWPVVSLILPLGLSFFAFEFIHYQVDLYRGFDAIRSPINFALFPAFFPTQIAGPIKRYQDFDAQLRSHASFDARRFLEGLELIALGMMKKIVLADTLLPIADKMFENHARAGILDSWVGVLAFSFQIYLDFSAYTDIGRGSAQLLGYVVPLNFRAPYLAISLRDFWRRWHMSLSSWLRDYLYIPLGGNRHGPWRTRLNLLATMALGGLWHGAAWHFLAWGVGHGVALAANRGGESPQLPRWGIPRWPTIATAWAATQLTVLLLWVLFRAPSSSVAFEIWRSMLGLARGGSILSAADRWTVVTIVAGVLLVQLVLQRVKPRSLILQSPASVILRPAYVTIMVLLAAQFASLHYVVHRFIYFQF